MATIKDVAKLSGVSTSTVSRVLNNDLTISVTKLTRENIFNAADKLGYKLKKNIKTSTKNYKIGICQWFSQSEETLDPYYLSIRMGAEKTLFDNKIEARTIFKERDGLPLNALNPVDGIIAIGKYSDDEISALSNFTDKIVFIDSTPNTKKYDSVVIDFDTAVKETLDYAWDIGHRKIGFIGGIEYIGGNRMPATDMREVYFKDYMSKKNHFQESYFRIGAFSYEEGYAQCKSILESDQLPTLIFAASDTIAIGAIRAIMEMGLSVPDDISIIGFDDINAAAYINPPLTTVRVYTEFMGATAVNLLIDKLNTNRTIPQKITIPTELICRNSVISKD